jgi:hypothetical protein
MTGRRNHWTDFFKIGRSHTGGLWLGWFWVGALVLAIAAMVYGLVLWLLR